MNKIASFLLAIISSSLYPNNFESWPEAASKPRESTPDKGGSISSIQPLLSGVDSRELSRQPPANFRSCLGIIAQTPSEKAFTQIYKEGGWGAEGYSGSGSELHNAKDYVAFLQAFLKEKNIRSVVDLGCGDWQFSKHIDWSDIKYYGYDVVEYLVERNQQRYGTPSITFIHGDGVDTSLPQADLLICKDVLQHLPNSYILRILGQLPRFKYCLITNDVDPVTLTCNNEDTTVGGYHGVDLTKPPFNINGKKVMNYRSEFVMKQVLLIEK